MTPKFHRLLKVLKVGKEVSVGALKSAFPNDTKYRLSVYLTELRRAGAVLEAKRDGRRVVSYTMTNAPTFAVAA